MRVTTTIKDYIYNEVKNKAAAALKVAAERRDEAVNACDAAYKKLNGIVNKIVDDANKKVSAAIKECGLSVYDREYFIANGLNRYHLNECCDNVNHKQTTALGKELHESRIEIVRLNDRIKREVGSIIFRLEAGAKYDEINSMIAAIKF